MPIVWQIETLRLPQDCKTVYHTKIRVSDVYWLHTKGEKVIQCEMGYEAVKAYVEEHNSEPGRVCFDPRGFGRSKEKDSTEKI